MKKTLLSLLTFLLISQLFIKTVLAAEEAKFSTDFEILYNVSENGETQVKQTCYVTNKSSLYYVSHYEIAIKNLEIYDVSAEDDFGEISPEIESLKDETKIGVAFNKPLIGINKVNRFSLFYKTKDIAKKQGLIWDIAIPQFANIKENRRYEITIETPISFGEISSVSPPFSETNHDDSHNFYIFEKEILVQGISATFGEFQLFEFKINYALKNDDLIAKKEKISLPIDIAGRQQTFIDEVTPKPQKIFFDEDGNILAEYSVKPNSQIKIVVSGRSKVYNLTINPSNSGNLKSIPAYLSQRLTSSLPYWEVDDAEIKNKAQEFANGESKVFPIAKKIYEFVTTSLKYDFSRLEEEDFSRRGAKKALSESEHSLCMDFSDLFVTLCRAAGIPSREIDGYVFASRHQQLPTSNEKDRDILHSWAEFYDPNLGWVPVDPTWGSTSGLDFLTRLDTNHLAFVRKGLSSELPLPPGSYETSPQEKKIFVSFGKDSSEPKVSDLRISIQKDSSPIGIISRLKKVQIENPNQSSVYQVMIGDKLIGNLPPFAKTEVRKKEQELSTVSYEDFEGKVTKIPLKKNDEKERESNLLYLLILPLALFLFLIFGKLLAPLVFPRKQSSLPPPRLRDQDQSPNQQNE